MADPTGRPVAMTITHPGDSAPYVAMNFAPRALVDDDFESQCGKVAWWDQPEAALPGALSTQVALITGHVMCGSTWYSIANMTDQLTRSQDSGREGDVLRVLFDSGDVTTSIATADVAVVEKAVLNTLTSTTSQDEPARITRVSTCDRSLPLRKDGRADYSAYMLFVRVA